MACADAYTSSMCAMRSLMLHTQHVVALPVVLLPQWTDCWSGVVACCCLSTSQRHRMLLVRGVDASCMLLPVDVVQQHRCTMLM